MVDRSKRCIAVAVAGLFLVGNLAGLAHFATTRHARCLEHNELIHLHQGRLDPGALVSPDDTVTSGSASFEGNHAHCGITIYNRVRMATVASFVPAAPAALATAVVPRDGDCAPTSVALYRIAPKTSPPA